MLYKQLKGKYQSQRNREFLSVPNLQLTINTAIGMLLSVFFCFPPLTYSQNEDVNALFEKLTDSYPSVREDSAQALGKIGDSRAVEPLIVALNDSNCSVREAAIQALGEIGPPAVESLIAALKDSNRYLRITSAEALGNIEDYRAGEALMAALKRKDLEIISGAYQFFVRQSDSTAIPLLINTLSIYGNEDMVECFLNSDNSDLKKAAKNWAYSRNYFIVYEAWYPSKDGKIAPGSKKIGKRYYLLTNDNHQKNYNTKENE